MTILHKNYNTKEESYFYSRRQLFFYVSFFFLLFFSPLVGSAFADELFYDSSLVDQETNTSEIKTYYHNQIDHLQKAVVPRPIHFVFSGNYRRYGRLSIRGILFTYKDTHAKHVDLIYESNGFKPIAMTRNSSGVWYHVLVMDEVSSVLQTKIRYKFSVDGIFYPDPTHNSYEEDNANGLISAYTIVNNTIKPQQGVIAIPESVGYGKKYIFRLYRPHAQTASLAGTFNSWNEELDSMKKNADGYFELTKTLPPGEYSFVFKVDGKQETVNATGKFRYHPVFGNVSYLQVK